MRTFLGLKCRKRGINDKWKRGINGKWEREISGKRKGWVMNHHSAPSSFLSLPFSESVSGVSFRSSLWINVSKQFCCIQARTVFWRSARQIAVAHYLRHREELMQNVEKVMHSRCLWSIGCMGERAPPPPAVCGAASSYHHDGYRSDSR